MAFADGDGKIAANGNPLLLIIYVNLSKCRLPLGVLCERPSIFTRHSACCASDSASLHATQHVVRATQHHFQPLSML